MGRKNIHTFSTGFQILLYVSALYHRLFYRRFKVAGRKNIPQGVPVIFSANHQNGLMDPLAIIFATMRQVVFFARADIFRKKFIARMLFFLKILPIYRPRDGFRSVELNKDMFDEVINVLLNNRDVGILPEGNHEGRKRLRHFRKGAARLALQAEEKAGFQLGLKIVPAGIDYSNYYSAGSDLLVLFGKPITVSSYRESYIKNPPRAVSELTNDLAAAVKKLVIDIEPLDSYNAIYTATEVYSLHHHIKMKKRCSLYENFLFKKDITEKLNRAFKEDMNGISELRSCAEGLSEKLGHNGIRIRTMSKAPDNLLRLLSKSFIMAILFPVHLYGMLMNYLPYRLPSYFARKARDMHLRVSIRFGAGFILFCLWYLLLTITMVFIPLTWYLKMIFLASLPLAGMFSFYYYRSLLQLTGKWRWHRLKRERPQEYDGIIFLKRKIIDRVIEAMNKMNA
jgi:1-acyl-sn-glycerol-3-phosphate acyltransferase